MAEDTLPVTGLVLHFRTPEKTLNCLQSMHAEGVAGAVIVDNSEDDGVSINAMQDALNALQSTGFHIEILSSGRNLGFAAGVNMGLKYISSKPPSHVLLINSDARLTQGALSHMQQILGPAVIVAPRIAQGAQQPLSPFAYYDRLLGLNTPTPQVMPLRYASGCCLLLHAAQISAPLFDEAFFFYGEDAMLGFVAKQRGLTELECPDAVVLHSTSSSAKNGSMFYEYHINRAHWLLAQKLARNPLQRFAFIAARCMTLPLRALLRGIRSWSLLACKGLAASIIDVLRGRYRSFTPPASGKPNVHS